MRARIELRVPLVMRVPIPPCHLVQGLRLEKWNRGHMSYQAPDVENECGGWGRGLEVYDYHWAFVFEIVSNLGGS